MGACILHPWMSDLQKKALDKLGVLKDVPAKWFDKSQMESKSDVLRGLQPSSWQIDGRVALSHPGIYCPLTDAWEYTEHELSLTPPMSEYAAILCTTDEGFLTVNGRCTLLFYAHASLSHNPLPSADCHKASIYELLLSSDFWKTHHDEASIETDRAVPLLLKKLVPHHSKCSWSCLHVFTAKGPESFRVPGTASHLVVMYMQKNTHPWHRCTLTTKDRDHYAIGPFSALHITKPPKLLKCASSVQGPYFILYLYGWQPIQEEPSGMPCEDAREVPEIDRDKAMARPLIPLQLEVATTASSDQSCALSQPEKKIKCSTDPL